jgi:hypothetical protein
MMTFPALDPELLQAFVAVADQRSFTRAAAALNRTQSAVSMQIKRLEERVGVELFHRTKANVDLSSAGEGLLGYARRILTLNDEAVARLREHKVAGVVRLGLRHAGEARRGLRSRHRHAPGGPWRRRISTTRAGGLGDQRRTPGRTTGPAAGRALSERLPVPEMGDGGARRRPAPLAPRLCQPQPGRCRGDRSPGPCCDRSTFPARLRALGESDGMPPLPTADICLHRAAKLSHAGALLADHLRMTILDETLLPHRLRHPQRPAKPKKMIAQT